MHLLKGGCKTIVFSFFQQFEVHAFMNLQYQQGLSLTFSQQSTQGEEYTDVTKTLTYMYI